MSMFLMVQKLHFTYFVQYHCYICTCYYLYITEFEINMLE